MIIHTSCKDGVLTIQPIGRLDSATAGELEETLRNALTESVTKLLIDMHEVDYISSKGLRVLVAAYRQLNGREMVIEGANSSVMDIFRLSGLLKVFHVQGSDKQ